MEQRTKQEESWKIKPEEIPVGISHRVNQKFADRFFQKIFGSDWAIKDLLNYVGEPVKEAEKIKVTYLNPVLIGNRRNDLSVFINQILYYFFEHQSTWNENMPIRLLFYLSRALENYLSGKNLFGKYRLKIPEVRCYTIFTGITDKISGELRMIQRLSDAYLTRQENRTEKAFDLELCVHCLDMRVTKEEARKFVKENIVPERFHGISSLVVQYAMFVNGVKYEINANKIGMDTDGAKRIVLAMCELFLERGYLVEYFRNKEVIDMAMEQISYEEAIRFEEREEGRVEGIKMGIKRGIVKSAQLLRKRGVDEREILTELSDEYEMSIQQIQTILCEEVMV